MGTIIEFPADAASRRPVQDGASRDGKGVVVILPVIRIERPVDENDGRGPAEGAAPGRRRRRRP